VTGVARVLGLLAAAGLLLAGCASAAAGGYSARTPQVRVTLAAGCPGSLGSAADVRNPGVGLTDRLVPDAPRATAALVCAYHAVDTRVELVRATRLGSGPATTLSRTLRAVSVAPPQGRWSCPADFLGAVTIIVLGYPGRPDVDLWYHTAGCRTIDNGHVSAFQGANRAFYDGFQPTLTRLVPGSD
jgi:hypothetical protein